jgi:hypothetical protein
VAVQAPRKNFAAPVCFRQTYPSYSIRVTNSGSHTPVLRQITLTPTEIAAEFDSRKRRERAEMQDRNAGA